MTAPLPLLAIIGGTGALGRGLVMRWAAAGYHAIVGSRLAENAERVAGELSAAAAAPVRGMTNAAAAREADIAVLAVQFAHRAPILADIKEAVRGKIVVDTTVPLVPPNVATVRMPAPGSAAQAAQAFLGPEVRVVSALQNVAAHKLQRGDAIDCDVLVCGDDAAARSAVVALVAALGLRALHAGPLANSVAAEALTSVLIGINRRYKVDGAGIRVTGNLADL